MANRRIQSGSGRRMDFNRNDRGKSYGRADVSPWQSTGPGSALPNLLQLGGGSTDATLALASNLIHLLQQPRQNTVPSLLDMPIRRDFGPDMGRYDRGYGSNRMGNQGNFRRSGNYNRSGERINTNRKPYSRPNDGQRQQNKSASKKDADSKANKEKESDKQDEKKEDKSGEQGEKKQDQNESPKTRYDDINPQFLKCHICNKSMWDGRSFENHLNGRAHSIMMQKTVESYALTADTMRQEFKIREMKRTRKAGQQTPRDFYCAMCDMYAADGAIHRTTVGHRRLKKYLHPNCTCCHKEMPTRIELDVHRLTAEHLKNFQDKQDVVTKPKPEVITISTLSMEQQYLREDGMRGRQRRDRQDGEHDGKDGDHDGEHGDHDGKDGDHDDGKDGDEAQTEGDIKKEPEDGSQDETMKEDKKKVVDNENTVLDYNEGDDLSNVTSEMLPAYSTDRGVGKSFLSEFRCIQCKLCRKMLDSEETAEVHLRTWRHHQLFTRLITDKSQINKQTQETEGQETEGQESSEATKRPMNSEESGNWKRRKTSPEHDDLDEDQEHEQNGDHNDVAVKAEKQGEAEGEAETSEVPPAEEMEDWEQSVDEILQDELENKVEEIEKEPEPVPEPEVKKEQTPPPPPATPKVSTPRGRGRGRGRGRKY